MLGRFCGTNLLLGAILQNKMGKTWRNEGCLQNLVGKNGKITPIYNIFWENHTDLQNFLGKSCFEKGKVKILFVKWRFLFQNWRFQVEKWRFQLESEDLKTEMKIWRPEVKISLWKWRFTLDFPILFCRSLFFHKFFQFYFVDLCFFPRFSHFIL